MERVLSVLKDCMGVCSDGGGFAAAQQKGGGGDGEQQRCLRLRNHQRLERRTGGSCIERHTAKAHRGASGGESYGERHGFEAIEIPLVGDPVVRGSRGRAARRGE